ncbi:transcription factor bHLH25-like [Solanum dulcamara]|uniref:transcription factor bHLH25-like n=1 Tax=Solanum dulcamara TaxID=45834 RepID=UPI0024865C28|nr:transcription factor bHLH25-like [Solanum dulcamara]
MNNSSLSHEWFSTAEGGVYYSNKNNSIDDFTTQKSSISEDQETSELSITPDSTRSYFYWGISKSKVSKIDFSLITPLENCPIGSKRGAIDHHQPKLNNNKSISSSSPRFLSFNNNNNMDSVFPSHQGSKIDAVDEMYMSDDKFFPYLKSKYNRAMKRIPSVDEDHIIAERKRREKLSQRFVALSAILPGLKKVDKASILEEAIKHVKEIKEKVKALEEEKKSRPSKQESVLIFVNKCKLEMEEADDEYSSSDENNNGLSSDGADIEVRFSDNNVLIRITCARRNAFVLNIHNEIEKLHLTIVQSCMMPFGKQAIDITLVAQMDESFCMTLKDLAKHVRMVTGRLMTQA